MLWLRCVDGPHGLCADWSSAFAFDVLMALPTLPLSGGRFVVPCLVVFLVGFEPIIFDFRQIWHSFPIRLVAVLSLTEFLLFCVVSHVAVVYGRLIPQRRRE